MITISLLQFPGGGVVLHSISPRLVIVAEVILIHARQLKMTLDAS